MLALSVVTIAAAISASTAPAFEEAGAAEFVTVYAGDCTTPQIVFSPVDTVCVQGGTFPLATGIKVAIENPPVLPEPPPEDGE
jgi:ribosomal protein S27E